LFKQWMNLYRKGISEPQRILPFFREKITRFSCLLGDGSWAPGPVSIKLYVNAECNAHCRMCDIGQKKQDSMFYRQSAKGGENISVKLLDKLLDEVCAYLPKVDFAGVEPLLNPDILELIDHVKKRRLFLSLTTNGMLLDHYAEKLVESGLDVIFVSVDGPEKIHNAVRGVQGAFQKVIAGLTKLKFLRESRHDKTLHIAVNYCINDLNVSTLAETASLIIDGGLADNFSIIHPYFVTKSASNEHNRKYFAVGLSTPTGPQESMLANINIDILWDQLCQVRAMFSSDQVGESQRFDSKTELLTYYHRPDVPVSNKLCIIPWQRSMIMSNGDIVIYNRCIPYLAGNLHQESFADVWNGEAYRRFRRILRKAGLFPVCSRCCGVV
jgi:Fe-coproporphyrin III synthase